MKLHRHALLVWSGGLETEVSSGAIDVHQRTNVLPFSPSSFSLPLVLSSCFHLSFSHFSHVDLGFRKFRTKLKCPIGVTHILNVNKLISSLVNTVPFSLVWVIFLVSFSVSASLFLRCALAVQPWMDSNACLSNSASWALGVGGRDGFLLQL